MTAITRLKAVMVPLRGAVTEQKTATRAPAKEKRRCAVVKKYYYLAPTHRFMYTATSNKKEVICYEKI